MILVQVKSCGGCGASDLSVCSLDVSGWCVCVFGSGLFHCGLAGSNFTCLVGLSVLVGWVDVFQLGLLVSCLFGLYVYIHICICVLCVCVSLVFFLSVCLLVSLCVYM